jgi:Tol biopolymer transport system component
MSSQGLVFARLASVGVLWSCMAAEEAACPTCSDALASDSAPGATPAPPAQHVGFCGDGVWDPEREQCDDGSACHDGRDCTHDRLRCLSSSESACQPRSADGCSDQCTVEPGFSCPNGRDCRALDPAVSETPALLAGPSGEAPEAAAPHPVPGTPDTRPPAGGPGRPERCREPSFRAPELLRGLDAHLDLWAPSLASDGRTLFLAANEPGLPEHIYFATRVGRSTQFSAPTLLANVDSGSGDGTPQLSADGRTLYFYSRRPGGSGDRDLWFATRPDAAADFGAASRLGATNSAAVDHLPWVSADELKLLYVSTRAGGLGQSDIWLARRERPSDDFGEPDLFSSISSAADEGRAVESSDGNLVLFASARGGGQGGLDLWLALREDNDEEFGAATNLSVLNSPSGDVDPFLSDDERELFFSSDRNGRPGLWRALIDCGDD